MKEITFKELLDDSTELGRARRKQLTANFDEMVERARTADLAWMEGDTFHQEKRVNAPHRGKKNRGNIVCLRNTP